MSTLDRYKVASLSVYAPEVLEVIRANMPAELELLPIKSYEEQEKLDVVADADFILAGAATVHRGVIDAAPKLRLIQKWGIGVDKIDLKAAAERGIPVTIAAGTNSVPVAELAITLMLSVYRRVPYVDRNLRQGRWLKSEMRAVCYQLSGKTVGLLGLGNIGRQVARRVRAFDCRVLYYDMARLSAEVEHELGVEFRPLDELLAQSDILSLHVPLLPSTKNLINAQAISLMKPTAVIINTARGGVIDEPALVDALKSGLLLGAGLDAFATEPLEPGNPLLEMDNVVLTPHVGGGVFDNVANVARYCFANMMKVINGEPQSLADLVRA